MKVMFINPNPRTMSLVQPVVSLFYSIFKKNGIDMRFFDTTLYDVSKKYTNSEKFLQNNLYVKRVDDEVSKVIPEAKPGTELLKDFRRELEYYQPDVLMASAMESTIVFVREMLGSIRDLGIPHVLGGVFATCAPDLAISYDEIDIVCVGEAEEVIVPLVNNLCSKKKISNLPGLWVKNKNKIEKSPIAPLSNLDDNPRFDASIYDDSRFYRMMAGKIYRMFPVETHRGCLQKCTFCNSPLMSKIYKDTTGQKYFRKKSIKKVVEDILYAVNEKNAEYFFFWADNFMLYSRRDIDEFCKVYADIKIPFYVQSYPTTIDEYKIKKLVSVGLHRIGIGIEHGNENFRKKVVNRTYSNKKAIEGVQILQKYDIPYSCNNIVGFPGETPELHMDTVRLNRLLEPHTASCSIFTPFHGTPLRELCLQLGYLKDKQELAPTNSERSILEMPDFTKDQISGKARTFNLYLKFPMSRWKEIEKAEANNPDGDKVWAELRQEYIEKHN